MSYGEVYIESDIFKMREAGYKKRFIINTIAKRIRYRYPTISKISSVRIATGMYNGTSTTKGWMGRRVKENPPIITARDRALWNKLNLEGI